MIYTSFNQNDPSIPTSVRINNSLFAVLTSSGIIAVKSNGDSAWSKRGSYGKIAADENGNLFAVKGNTIYKIDNSGKIVSTINTSFTPVALSALGNKIILQQKNTPSVQKLI